MKHKGHNNYKLPHMKKDSLIQQEMLPINLQVPTELVIECIKFLVDAGRTQGIKGLMDEIGFDMNAA